MSLVVSISAVQKEGGPANCAMGYIPDDTHPSIHLCTSSISMMTVVVF